MGKRIIDTSVEGPPKKKNSSITTPMIDIKPGEILTDIVGKQWKLGKSIGVGGFGEIFLASDDVHDVVTCDSQYVAKVETHTNGPLFVEINCYLRIAKKNLIDEWKTTYKIENLGMPYYVTSGSHTTKDEKYRFLIIPRFAKDLEQVFISKKCKFNLKTVLTIASQLLDTLEYIHGKGYVHSDIKASNLLLKNKYSLKENRVKSSVKNAVVRCNGTVPLRTCRVKKLNLLTRCLRPKVNSQCVDMEDGCDNKIVDLVYLSDFGLASKYLRSSGEHKEFCTDERRAHAGTILFCSLDAHKGAQSRRSDLESLGYNIIYWLTSKLPWINDIKEPVKVHKKKLECLTNLHEFLASAFITPYPKFLYDYFKYLIELEFTAKPDYDYCRKIFGDALKDYGYKNDSIYDFDNLEGWGNKQKKIVENKRFTRLAYKINRVPLTSNLPVKPQLRKKRKNKEIQKLNWSQILMDPEILLKQRKPRDRKLTDTSDSGILSLDINELNPTAMMLEVYNRSLERAQAGSSPKYKGDCIPDHIEGYTSAMMIVHNRKKVREELELEKMAVNNAKSNKLNKNVNRKKCTNKKGSRVQKVKSAPDVNNHSTRSGKFTRSCRG